ncbi:protein argonaute-2-like isoform X2 [Antedon mediterranea]|uniref:protein argonaute-2-like isoform X2 n=1 Tax=Antedon mediterranea TaxID=105859 RepID=UPI003AF8F95C
MPKRGKGRARGRGGRQSSAEQTVGKSKQKLEPQNVEASERKEDSQQPKSGASLPEPQLSSTAGITQESTTRLAHTSGARPKEQVERPKEASISGPLPVAWGHQTVEQKLASVSLSGTSPKPVTASVSLTGPTTPKPVTSGGQKVTSVSLTGPTTPKPVTSGGQKVISPARTDQVLQLVKRRGYGTSGRPIQLYSNHFRVKFPTDVIIFQYDMSTQPEKLPKKKLRDIFEEIQNTNRNIFAGGKCVFDGRKCVYSPAELRFTGAQVDLNVEKKYEGSNTLKAKVTLKKVATIDLHDLHQYLSGKLNFTPYVALQAMDVIMRYYPSMRFTPVGRSLFCEPRQNDDFNLGGGLELHKGFFQSMRPAAWKDYKMSVNIDVSNTAFYKPGPVLDFMVEVLNMRRDSIGMPVRDAERKQFEKIIKGLQIEVRREPSYKRKFRVIGVTAKEAQKLTFPLTDDKGRTSECVVAKYFFDKYGIRLRYPRLPCLHVGQPDKKTYIPIEMCHVVANQPCRRKLTPMQTSDMIKKTAIPAPDRLREIQNWIKEANHSGDPYLKSFGISIDPNLLKIPGRVLAPPDIKYKQAEIKPREGSWNLQGRKFHNAVSVKIWGILCFENERFCRYDDLNNMHDVLTGTSAKIGMPMASASFVQYESPHNVDFVKMFQFYCQEHQGLQLIFIVLPGKGNDIYGDIKNAGDAQVGIATQNIQLKNAKKASPRTMENICLKINAKLGGINNVINQMSSVMREPALVLGADVTHPSPGDFHRPSIAAVVGSKDKHTFKYDAKVKVQAHRQEIIEDLDKMVTELLINFKKCTGVQPKKIIMYRDGVSEGQFQQVLDSELMAIRRACSSLHSEYKPGITFLTVQKRHHTRLFCVDRRDENGRGRNVPAGTIVDRDITHPVNWDFFLCSHAGIQGTSRPAHYYVLWDDNDFTQNQLEEFTNQMCYTYARCTRSTSIPSPAYYAHHAAFRARDILYSDLRFSDSGSTTNSGGSDQPKITSEELKKMNNTVEIDVKQNSRMYYA